MRKYLLIAALAAFTFKASAQVEYKRTTKGTQYRLITNNPGERIKEGQVITFNVIQKTDKDSVLFNTYTAGNPVKTQVQSQGDLMDVFMLMTAKDSVWVKVPNDTLFKGHEESRPPFLPKGSNLNFIIKMEQVQSLDEAIAERNAQMEKIKAGETASREKYIADHKLILQTTASGLKYVITQPSAKRKPIAGDTLLVNYVGRTTDGKVFDTSIQSEAQKAGLMQPGRPYEPLQLVVGRQQVIAGWDEGLLLLNEGSKATFVIPSDLGYGAQGAGADIKPFNTLVFDVELVKVKPAKKVIAKSTVRKSTSGKATAKKMVNRKPAAKPSPKKK